ncbi:MAG TPA: PKD domain-containing protein [Phycisphaerae bacterium]|nr:PKD domain-containing protein [Phycisphaerae bacterium]
MKAAHPIALAACLALAPAALALDRPDTTFKIFQFPPDKIPRIDGKADDWDLIPDSYIVGSDQMVNDSNAAAKPDPKNLDVKVKVAWVKGESRLYFLYQADDNVCDYGEPGLHNDTFEVIVDADKSGGNLIARNPDKSVDWPNWLTVQSVHAQNYHVFVPAQDKDWAMMWGPQAQWIKKMPWSNYAATCTAKPGQPGKVTAEFWITPFDHADADGPEKSKVSTLKEGETIALSWAVIDYDDPKTTRSTFWNLSRTHTMYGDASHLCSFKLMPLESQFLKKLDAQWSFKITDAAKREVAFHDDSLGKVTSWKWDFGDGETSTDQNPTHAYKAPNNYIVTLDIEGPEGKSRHQKVWDVSVK